MLLDTQSDVLLWGTSKSAWSLLDRTVEAEKRQGLCRLGVQGFATFDELWSGGMMIP